MLATRTRVVAAVLSALLATASIAYWPSAPAAEAAGEFTLDATTSRNALAGDVAEVTLRASSASSDPDFYNLTMRYVLPVGVTYVGGSTEPAIAGEPTVITVTTQVDPGPPPVTQQHQVLIWQNVADLPSGDDFELGFSVLPDPALYPVGAEVPGDAGAYANTNPRVLPKFDAEGDPESGFDASDEATPTPTIVSALRLTKSEPSPESELMRGVHDKTTTYTLTITNTDQAATEDVVLVDYLPAGLEFLGCGATDNSAAQEYPGSGWLTGTPVVPDCVVPDSVRTVTDPDGLPDGVYTEVTWSFGRLELNDTRTVAYAAGIPLHSNTTDWPVGEPSPESLEQGSNLDNNTGASTRQEGLGTTFANHAIVSGTYTGPLAPGASAAVGDERTEGVVSSDLSIVKSASTSTFTAGSTVTFSLLLRASEYTTDGAMTIVDTIPDGLCPLVPEGTTIIGTLPDDCTAEGTVTGATLDSVTVEADGTFRMELTPDPEVLTGAADLTITYPALMRDEYASAGMPTAAGDSFRNEVSIEGISTTVDDEDGQPLQNPAEQEVADDSSAGLGSTPPSIQKEVLPRTDLGTDPCPAAGYIDLVGEASPQFQLGDRVCFLLTVDFSDSTETRNAQITDFVPVGTSFASYSVVGGTVPDDQVVLQAGSGTQGAPTWTIGTPRGDATYVAQGAVLRLAVSAIVVAPSDSAGVDITANLMKYRQESTSGRVLSLRDEADFGIAPPAVVGLDKGVLVDGDPQPSASTAETSTHTFRLTATNLGTVEAGNAVDEHTVVVWDALPEGIVCADVSAITSDGTCTDDFAGFSGADAGRSAIVWTIAELPIGASAAVEYDLTVPRGTSVSVELVNDASVVSFRIRNTAGGDTLFYPRDSLDRLVAGNTDPANASARLVMPDAAAEPSKAGTTSIGETNNNVPDQAVAGELVDYSYSVTIPANSSVYAGVLSDTLPAQLSITGDTVITADLPGAPGLTPATMPGGWSLESDGTLRFPPSYDNQTEGPLTFTVHLAGVLVAANATVGAKVNTATFASTAGPDGPAVTPRQSSYTVTVVEPQPNITKTVAPTTVTAGQTVTFTIKAWNANGRPPLHSAVVEDCLPAGLAFDEYGTNPGLIPQAGGEGNSCATGTTYLRWELGTLEPTVSNPGDADKVILTYTAIVDPAAAGLESYTNSARITGSTLVGGGRSFTASSSAAVTVGTVVASKAVADARRTIGQTTTYTITVPLPADVNFYSAAVIDTLPVGVTAGTATVSCTYPDDSPCTMPGAGAALSASGQLIGWYLGDMLSESTARTVRVTLPVTVADVPSNSIGATVTNSAVLKWFPQTQGTPPTSAGATFGRTGTAGTVGFIATGPSLSLAKSVTNATPAPGDVFEYRVTATAATGTNNTDAYSVVIVDTVPAGVVVDAGTISDSGVLTGATANGGGTITWNIASIARGTPEVLTYSAVLAPSATLTAAAKSNSVRITSYRSLPDAGRTYPAVGPRTASVTPRFPAITLQKLAADPAVAYVGDPFAWTLRLTNTGNAVAATVTPTDVLPPNWSYDAQSAYVSVNGGTAVQIDPATIVEEDGRQTLTWAPLTNLAVGQAVVIQFTATPQEGALTDPGVIAQHVNTLSAVATDATGATGRAAGSYAASAVTASARIHSADVSVVKTGTDLVAGTTGTGWSIVVANGGPDPAVGPFVVTDDALALPEGVTVNAATGTGWTCTTPDAGDFTCTRNGTLASGASWPAIAVTVQVAADVAPGTELENTATVSAKTFDPNGTNNSSTANLEITASADLALTKAINGTARAGQTVSWTIGVSNSGPSVAAGPFTVTDTIPAGVTGVTAAGTGWACTTGEGVVDCVHEATAAVGPIGSITVTGTLAASATGDLVNEVDVTQTTTPDPTPGHAESSTPIDSSTTLAVTKTLVAPITPPAEAPAIVPGAPATYEITVTNTGQADAVGVALTDPLPAGLTLTEAIDVAGTWTCTGSDAVACDLAGSLVPGGSATVRLVVAVPSDLTAPVDNTATADADNAPPASGSSLDPSTPFTNWAIEKSHPEGPVLAGTELTYTLAVTNLGPSDETGAVTVTDSIPVGMSAVSATGTDWTCDLETQPVTCTYGEGVVSGAALPPIELVVRIAPDAGPATIVNTASVRGTLPATDTSRATDSDPTVVTDSSVVTITKSADPGVVVAGTSVDYTITLHNEGPSVADTLVVTDLLPAGLVVTAIAGDGWVCSPATLVCTRDTLAPGDSTLTLTAAALSSVPDGTVLTNTATVAWLDGAERATASDTEPITIAAEADLALTKRADAPRATAGETATFTLEVENLGPSDAVGSITVVDTLPEGLSYLGASADWSCAPDGLVVTCTLLPALSGLGAGTSAPDLVLTVQVDAATGPVTLTNSATAFSPTADPDPTNNTGEAAVEIDQSADLAVVKSHDGPGLIGQSLAFDLVVTNDGPSVATGVVVVDTLPLGLTYLSSEGSDPEWSCTAGEPGEFGTDVTCTLAAPLAPDAAAPALVIVTEVSAAAYPSVDNVAVVSSDIPDPEPENDSWTDPVEVDPLVSLTVTKQHVGDLRKGQLGQYRVVVSNAGPTEDPGGFTITDALPAGLEYRGFSGEDVTCTLAAGVVTCVFEGPLPVDGERSVVLDVAVLADAPDVIVNEAIVASLWPDLSEDHVGVDRATVLPALPVTGGPALVLLAGLALLALAGGAVVVVARRIQRPEAASVR